MNIIRLAAIAAGCTSIAAARAQILLNFDELPAVNHNAGTFIGPASRVSTNYLSAYGILFTSGGGYVGVVDNGTSLPNGISGSTSGNLVTYGQANPISATFWMPSNPSMAAGTNFVFLQGDTDPTNGGWQVTLNGYDLNNNLVASNTVTDVGGETLTITSASANIHRIVFLGSPGDFGGVGVDNFMFNPVSPVPEPTTAVAVGLGLFAACRRRRRT
jgi:hypothetical protein